ncbi:mechanosensitive ion channel [Mycoplasmatota bacterium]|nr:mechanosensitive ion channel [Mycoplasmatota bacterium]
MFKDFKLPEFNYEQFYDVVVVYGLKVIISLILLFVGLKLIKWFIKRINRRLDKSKIDPSLKSFLSPLIRVILKITLLLSIISMFGVEVTSFIALLGSFGFAIGLALQGSLSNFAGGVLILLFKPFKVGDYIEAQGFSGTVKDIHIFYTILSTPDNKKIVIPNSGLSNASLINYSAYPTRRLELKLSCSYENDTLMVKQILEKLISDHPLILKDPKPVVYLNEYVNNSINFIVRGWAKSSDYWKAYYELMLSVKGEFDRQGISIPYPQLDVHMKSEK